MAIIEGGTGRGYKAKVNDRNQLVAKAVTSTEEHQVCTDDSNAYFANSTDAADTITVGTGTTHNVMYIKNNSSTKELVIEKVLTSANTAGGVVKWTRNPTLGTIGANTTHEPVNLNFGSATTADVTCYTTDETAGGLTGLSGGTTIKTFITSAGFTIHPIDGAIVIPQGSSILFSYTNGTGGDIEFEIGVRFYLINMDD